MRIHEVARRASGISLNGMGEVGDRAGKEQAAGVHRADLAGIAQVKSRIEAGSDKEMTEVRRVVESNYGEQRSQL